MHTRGRHDVVTIPTIRIAFVLSILVHAALLWLVWPHLRSLTEASQRQSTSLAVDLAPRNDRVASATVPTPTTPPRASVPARPPPSPPVAVPRKRPAQPPKPAPKHAPPPVIAQRAPAPATIEQPPVLPAPPTAPATQPRPAPPVATPPPMPAPPAQDLASYVEAQRRARGEASDPSPGANASAESEIARRDRIVAANLGLNRTPSFGTDVRNAGGLFQITELNYDDARFYFFGFDKAIGRNARQLIEVRRGSEPDIRIAIVRKMIAIIRESIDGDFVWVSQRLGHGVTLSSRAADNAGLEAFILRDIFPDARLP
jgi:hypothetical protein